MAYIRHGPGVVVCSCFYNDGNAIRCISFISDFLVIRSIFRDCSFDSPFYIFFRHIFSLGILNQNTKTGIVCWVGATGFYGNIDFFSDSGKRTGHITPSFQFACFAVFKRSSHNIFYLIPYFVDIYEAQSYIISVKK